MSIPYNFHCHSNYSDGAAKPEEYIVEAIKQGFRGLGFSEHSVLPFSNSFALKKEDEDSYINEIERLKKAYQDEIDIFRSLEADYIPGLTLPMLSLKEQLKLDYLIGSIHLVINRNEGPFASISGIRPGKESKLMSESSSSENRIPAMLHEAPIPDGEEMSKYLWFIDGPLIKTYDEGINGLYNGDIKKAVTAYWHQLNEMISNEKFDIVGHLDKIKMHNQGGRWFNEQEKWYQSLVDETIELIAEKEVLVEVNTRGLYKKRSTTLFPDESIIKRLYKKKVGIVISSDSHHPSEISMFFEQAIQAALASGYRSCMVFNKPTGASKGKWVDFPLD